MPRGSHGVTKGPLWTDERAQRLRTLFAQGKRDPEIAYVLCVTTGAVIGKRQRMGLFRAYRNGDHRGSAYDAALRRAELERKPKGADDHHPGDGTE